MEACGDELFGGGIWEEIAGDLVGGELVERKVVVEGGDDPVAIRPHFTVIVEMHAVGVGISGGVKPVAGAMFAVGGGLEKFLDELRVGGVGKGSVLGFWEVTSQEVWRWGETSEVERDAPDEGVGIGFGRGGEFF